MIHDNCSVLSLSSRLTFICLNISRLMLILPEVHCLHLSRELHNYIHPVHVHRSLFLFLQQICKQPLDST